MKSAEIKKLPLVLVIWSDITTESAGWISFDDIENLEAAICYTPGWIIREDEKNIYMVQNFGSHKDVWEPSVDCTIPKGCIEEIRPIRKSWHDNTKRKDSAGPQGSRGNRADRHA
jgi:hypothetical protein